MREYFSARKVPSNVWLGVSVEDQKYGIPRIDDLRMIVATIRFISAEPLLEDLGELDLTSIHWLIVGGELRTSPLFIDMLKPCNSKENSSFNMSIEMDGLMGSH